MKSANQKVLIFVADEYEDMELNYPKIRLVEAGKQVVTCGEKKGFSYKGKYGVPCLTDLSFEDVNVKDFCALIIPGGYAPDKLRTNPNVLTITKQFHKEQKLIAFICHAGWIPISAQIIKGIKSTSYAAIKDDMVNAGALWVDEAVVVDNHFISSRCPEDLPHFCHAIITFLDQKK